MSKKLTQELISKKLQKDNLNLETITELNLWGNNLEDISLINKMPSLEVVSLNVNRIKTLSPFSNLRYLRELYLRRNLISNINEIKNLINCENLSVLCLGENPISENQNYRAIVICILTQLKKLDNITITNEERIRAEKKIKGNLEEEDNDEHNEENSNDSNDNDEEEQDEENKIGFAIKSNNKKQNNKINNGIKNGKTKGNRNILNCVINLMKELSPNELQVIQKELNNNIYN